jgi:segregation and condensation protein A
VTFAVKQETYEGPLDALLQLIEAEELDITTVSLAAVTDQYLAHVETLEQRNLPEISDWLVIAARLILLKSRALLAVPAGEDEEVDDLAAQLMEYKKMKELAEQLGRELDGAEYLTGGRPLRVTAPEQVVTDGVDIDGLHAAFVKVLEELPLTKPLRSETLEPQVTIEERIDAIRQTLRRGKTSFGSLFKGLQSRVAMIVTFLAVLELVKQRTLAVSGSGSELAVELRA